MCIRDSITAVDTSEAEAQKGVLAVITFKNAEKLAQYEKDLHPLSTTSIQPVLQSNEVHYYGEYVGMVVAETFEQAQYAARLVKYTYDESKPDIDFQASKPKAYKPTEQSDYSRGDVASGLAEADVTLDETYVTPIEHHHPMELHALIGSWNNGNVQAYASQQMIDNAAKTIADTFKIDKKNVRVMSPYVGGGFGSKLAAKQHVILALMASKAVGRPVQFTVTRTQMFTNTNLRQRNEQRLQIGAKKDGTLTCLLYTSPSPRD